MNVRAEYVGLAIMALAAAAAAQTVDESAVKLRFVGTGFAVTLPVMGAAGTVQTSVELLDTNGAVRSRAARACGIVGAATMCKVTLPPAADPISHGQDDADLAHWRVRYSACAAGGSCSRGILALDHIAPELFVIEEVGPREIRPGGTFSVRIRTVQPLTGAPQAGVALRAEVTEEFTGDAPDRTGPKTDLRTDKDGFATVTFTAPSVKTFQKVNLGVEGRLANLHVAIEQDFFAQSATMTSLTADKPLYQPGQTVHLRMLALDHRGHVRKGAQVTLDVRDPENTLVYRTTATTSAFGIAAADWTTAARLRLGSYSIEASGEGLDARTEVRLSRYDLPQFTVEPKPDKPYYLPGQNAVVKVRGDYLFGKPVTGGHVRVVRESGHTWNFAKQQYDTTEGKVVEGELGADGSFTANIDLSADAKEMADDEPSSGYSDINLAAYLTDSSTGRTEQRRFDVRLAVRPLQVYVVQDGRDAAAGLPLGFTLVVSTADGLPAAGAEVQVALLPRENDDPKEKLASRIAHALTLKTVRTNEYGVARVDGLPDWQALEAEVPPPVSGEPVHQKSDPELLFQARLPDGRAGQTTSDFEEPTGALRLRTDHTLYKPGQSLEVTVESATDGLPVTLQVYRTTTTGLVMLFTDDLVIHGGKAHLRLDTHPGDTPDAGFQGLLYVTAFTLPKVSTVSNDRPEAATKTVLFPHDNSLQVAVKMARQDYRPGEMATASVDVTGPRDPDGEPTGPERVALGVTAVDQAVLERNRTDNDFGGSVGSFFWPYRGYYFYNRVSVGDLSVPLLERWPAEKPFAPSLDLAASVVLARDGQPLKLQDDRPSDNLAAVFDGEISRQTNPVREVLSEYLKTSPDAPTDVPGLDALLAPKKLSIAAQRDPWGMPWRLETRVSYNYLGLVLVSDGPDKLPGTLDDFEIRIANWQWFARHQRELTNTLLEDHAKTGLFVRDLPGLRAAMLRQGIDVDAWRDVWGQPLTWTFPIQQADYQVIATSAGEPGKKSPVFAGSAGVPWFSRQRMQVQDALTAWAKTHDFPRTTPELDVALASAGVKLVELRDPWGHAVYPAFRVRTVRADRVTVEARAHAGETPAKKLTVVPVTEVLDTVDLRSAGEDGIQANEDDFAVATLTHVRSQQAAKEAGPATGTGSTVRGGDPIITSGGVLGTVTDPTGAVIAGVMVTATNEATGTDSVMNTDQNGDYGFSALAPGRYTLKFELPGFQTTVIDQVLVHAPDATLLDARLGLGTASETVEVTAGAVMLDTVSAMSGSVSLLAGTPMMLSRGVYVDGYAGGQMQPAPPPPPPPGQTSTPRLREYFPETLLWRPEVLTAPDGQATLRFPVADSITAWQLSVAASTLHGNTGGGQASFRTVLPFFAALDVPQVLTVGDRLELPVALRNYLDHPVTVRSETAPAAWLRVDKDAGVTEVPAQNSASPLVTMTAIAPAREAKLQFTARPGGAAGDRVERALSVHPDGQESGVTAAGIVRGSGTFALDVPADALPSGGDVVVKVYPSLAAHLRDALVSMAWYPGGCAEQTISVAWPSLLLLRYEAGLPNHTATAGRKVTSAQARRYLEEAYANLLGNRDPKGGFKYWPNDARADLALTAYAVEFLTAAREYISVDDGVIEHAVEYLAMAQDASGLWVRVDREGNPHPEDKNANTMLTASMAAMLVGAPKADEPIAKAVAGTEPFVQSVDEPYTIAAYLLSMKDPAAKAATAARLKGLALSEDGGAYWKLETNTPFFGWGRAGRVETTATVLRALLAAGVPAEDDTIGHGLLWLERQQDRHGLWYSTQGSARVLDVLAAVALRSPATGPGGKGLVRLDGAVVGSVTIPPAAVEGGPVLLALPATLTPGRHTATVELPPGASAATAQVVGTVYRPWSLAQTGVTNNERLELRLAYDHPDAAPGELIQASAHVERIGFRGYGMLIAEIGLPPGADVDRASLETLVASSSYAVNHYEVLPDRVVLYLWPAAGGTDLKLGFRMRYRVNALSAGSEVYDYYNSDARFVVAPVRFGSLR